MKPDRIRFLLFVRILFRYLQRKEEEHHQHTYETLKLALHDCATRARRGEKGYESLSVAMKKVILETVSRQDLQRARGYMERFVQRKQEMHHPEDPVWKILVPTTTSSTTTPISQG